MVSNTINNCFNGNSNNTIQNKYTLTHLHLTVCEETVDSVEIPFPTLRQHIFPLNRWWVYRYCFKCIHWNKKVSANKLTTYILLKTGRVHYILRTNQQLGMRNSSVRIWWCKANMTRNWEYQTDIFVNKIYLFTSLSVAEVGTFTVEHKRKPSTSYIDIGRWQEAEVDEFFYHRETNVTL